MLTDPIADMLSRIRNANRAMHDRAQMPNSRMKQEIARLLKEEGYISDYHVERGESFDTRFRSVMIRSRLRPNFRSTTRVSNASPFSTR